MDGTFHPDSIQLSDGTTILSMRDPDTLLTWYDLSLEEITHLVHERGASLAYRDPHNKGNTPLHSAAQRCAEEHVRWFLANGAPWNQLNNDFLTPAELALSKGHQNIYDIIFQSAVEKEWTRLYLPHQPEDTNPWLIDIDKKDNREFNQDYRKHRVLYVDPRIHINPKLDSFSMVLDTGVAVMSEWERPIMQETARLLFDGMKPGMTCLNVGFGMGIIDTYFQSFEPSLHIIIESHPNALQYMRKTGWYDKPNVRILEGRWQDFIDITQGFTSDIESMSPEAHTISDNSLATRHAKMHGVGRFDIVYFDTFAEGYRGHLDFWKCVPSLLRGPGSRFSFFHGFACIQTFTYRVYSEVSRLHLNDLGLDTVWHYVDVDTEKVWTSAHEEKAREKETRRTLTRQAHAWDIPICTLAPTVPRKILNGCGWASSNIPMGDV